MRVRVLVYVDPDPTHVVLMGELVAEAGGGELVAAATLEDGLDAARERGADLMLVDVDRPGVLERDPVRLVRGASPSPRPIPLVAVSAPGAMRGRSRRALDGFDRVLTRPIEVDELARVLDELTGQDR